MRSQMTLRRASFAGQRAAGQLGLQLCLCQLLHVMVELPLERLPLGHQALCVFLRHVLPKEVESLATPTPVVFLAAKLRRQLPRKVLAVPLCVHDRSVSRLEILRCAVDVTGVRQHLWDLPHGVLPPQAGKDLAQNFFAARDELLLLGHALQLPDYEAKDVQPVVPAVPAATGYYLATRMAGRPALLEQGGRERRLGLRLIFFRNLAERDLVMLLLRFLFLLFVLLFLPLNLLLTIFLLLVIVILVVILGLS